MNQQPIPKNIPEAKGNLVPINTYIKSLQQDIDDLEWDGIFYKADFLKKLLDEAYEIRDNGGLYYPLF